MKNVPTSRRGLAVLVVVVLLAAANIVVIGTLSGSAADASIASFRVDSVRACYATESGAIAVVKTTQLSSTRPTVGTTYTVGNGTFVVTAMPAVSATGSVNVTGVSGSATRRMRVQVQ